MIVLLSCPNSVQFGPLVSVNHLLIGIRDEQACDIGWIVNKRTRIDRPAEAWE